MIFDAYFPRSCVCGAVSLRFSQRWVGGEGLKELRLFQKGNSNPEKLWEFANWELVLMVEGLRQFLKPSPLI